MPRRVLGATALIEPDPSFPLLDAEDKPLKTEKSVRDAVARVTKDLTDMASKYHAQGWVEEGEVLWNVTPDDIVIGRQMMVRD